MSYTRKAVRGMGVIFAMNIVVYIIAYVTRLILARTLGPAAYGLFYSVFTFVIFFLFFRDLGLNQALTKYITEFRVLRRYNEIKSAIASMLIFQLASSALFSALFFLLADTLAAHYFRSPAAAPLVRLMALYTLFSIVFIFLKGFFAGFQRFKVFALIDTAKNGIVLLLVLAFFSLNLSVFAPALAYVLAGPLLLITFLPAVMKVYNPFRYKLERFGETAKKLVLFGLPVIMTDIGDKVIGYIDTLMLTSFRSLEEVGIYNVALPSAMALLFFSSSIASVAFPLFAELWTRQDTKRLAGGLRLLHKYTFILAAPVVLTVFAFAAVFLRLFFGEAYVPGAHALQILLIGVLLFIVAGINHSIIAATGNPKAVTKIVFVAAALNIIINFLLIPRFGIEGAALATAASYAAALLLSTAKVTQLIRAPLPWWVWLRTAVAALVFIGGIYSIRSLIRLNPYAEIAASITGALALYLFSIWLFRLIDPKEIRFYLSLVLRRKTVEDGPA